MQDSCNQPRKPAAKIVKIARVVTIMHEISIGFAVKNTDEDLAL
jgi:hypothetical protein